jgi:hypothetical protein
VGIAGGLKTRLIIYKVGGMETCWHETGNINLIKISARGWKYRAFDNPKI